ncbi:MAG: MltA domain-containing protein, partial [Syntrophales bacterium]|nr:MltA domain-containing protein [Syntrophales bacterium]
MIEFNGERDMKTSVLTGVLLITIFLSGLFSGCTTAVKRPPSEAGTPDHMVKLIPERIPLIEDDLDRASLVRAIEKSLVFLDRIPEDRLFKFGRDTYTAREMKESLMFFYEIMGSTLDNRRLAEVLRKKFNVYQCLGLDGEGSILYTGYYEPVLEGSKFRTSRF